MLQQEASNGFSGVADDYNLDEYCVITNVVTVYFDSPPSSWGGHPLEYIVIRDRNTLRNLARCKRMGAGPLAYSDVAIVPIVDRRRLELWVEDAAVASTYLLLAAEACGIGACWIHMKDRQGHTGTAEEDIRALLGIPEFYGILNVVSLGMKKDSSVERTILPKTHEERYQE